jgi:outer membrane protein
MTRNLIASALMTVLAVGTAQAYQTPPPAQTPPQAQTPPPTRPPAQTPPPLMPQTPAARPPAPVIPFPADAKIGFVNLQAVVADSKLGKAGQASMAEFATRINTDLTALQKTVSDLQKELQSGAGVLSATAIATKQSQLNQKTRDLQYAQDDANAKLDEFNKNLLEGFSDKVVPIVEELRAEKGLWVIFAVQNAEGGGLAVLAAHAGLDLSGEVVKRLDVKHPGK